MTKTVLVFENDASFANELQMELSRLGCDVHVARDGDEGLRQAASSRPNLILLAIELPGMNGFSVCNKLKKDPALKDVPVIILSSDSTDETFEQHKKLRNRAQAYVHKPVALAALLAHIRPFVDLGVALPPAKPVAANVREWSLPREGGCRCGRVRIRVTAPPLLTMACHCVGCQRMSASAFSSSAAIPSDGFAVIQGEPVIGGLHGPTRHYFCPHCMSWMFTRPEGIDYFVNVRPTMLDDTRGIAPFIETFAGERLAWATTGARYTFEKLPAFEDYAALTKEYVGYRKATSFSA